MNGDHTILVEILNAIEHGTLSVHETRRRLEDIIDEEILKTDSPANMQLIEECEKLLWELNTNGNLPFVDHLNENKSIVFRLIKKQQSFRVWGRNIIRIGIITTIIIISSICVESILHMEWLSGTSSIDEQQFIIHGQKFDPNTIETSTADTEHQYPDEFSTNNYSEIIEFFGFDPCLSTSPSELWNITKYTCSRSVDDSTLYVDYVNHKNDTIKLTIVYYSTIEDAVMYVEQNSTGEFIRLTNHNIYITQNHDRTIATWNANSTVYRIRSNLSLNETLSFIESLLEEM